VVEQKFHWDTIYRQKRPGEVSWYQPYLNGSLKLLANAGLQPNSRVIDVGGGASTLVDDLLGRGIRDITVLDISDQALTAAKGRLGERADGVNWMEADILQVELPAGRYDIWHDRALFHFLTNPADRRRYIETMSGALKPNGQLIIATFSTQGPSRCSGLEVIRYSPETLQAELGDRFKRVESVEEEHQTPFHTIQKFIYARFEKI